MVNAKISSVTKAQVEKTPDCIELNTFVLNYLHQGHHVFVCVHLLVGLSAGLLKNY